MLHADNEGCNIAFCDTAQGFLISFDSNSDFEIIEGERSKKYFKLIDKMISRGDSYAKNNVSVVVVGLVTVRF